MTILLLSKNFGLVKGVVVCVCIAKGRSVTQMTILEDLYYGNINPQERYIKRRSKADELVKVICKNEENLTSTLTEQQKGTFEKFKACYDEMTSITEREAFSDGFILATRIMAEIMQGMETVEEA